MLVLHYVYRGYGEEKDISLSLSLSLPLASRIKRVVSQRNRPMILSRFGISRCIHCGLAPLLSKSVIYREYLYTHARFRMYNCYIKTHAVMMTTYDLKGRPMNSSFKERWIMKLYVSICFLSIVSIHQRFRLKCFFWLNNFFKYSMRHITICFNYIERFVSSI